MSEALTVHDTTDVARVDMGGAMVPLDQALAIAGAMQGAITLPKHWQSKADLTAAVLTAMQWRVPLMAVIRGCHLIDGKVSPSADLMAGIAQGSHQIAEWVEEELHNPTGHRISILTTDGRRIESSFTEEDARAAGLLTKDNWRKYMRDMCRARAVSRAASRACPAIFAGIYSEEELGGAEPRNQGRSKPASAPAAQATTTGAGEVIEAEFAGGSTATVPPDAAAEQLCEQLCRDADDAPDAKTLAAVIKRANRDAIDAEHGGTFPTELSAIVGEAIAFNENRLAGKVPAKSNRRMLQRLLGHSNAAEERLSRDSIDAWWAECNAAKEALHILVGGEADQALAARLADLEAKLDAAAAKPETGERPSWADPDSEDYDAEAAGDWNAEHAGGEG